MVMKLKVSSKKFNGVLVKNQGLEVYKLCSMYIKEDIMTLHILETSMQEAQFN